MQIIHFQYKDDDSTYMMNNRLTGIVNAGVHRGFNLDSVSGRTLMLKGDSYEVLPSGTEEHNVSVLMTPQGCIIKETDIVQVTLAANTSANPRVDLIYCQHSYVEVEGGTTAIYGVRSGTIANPPKIQLKKSQVAIAFVTVPAGWTGGDNLTYKREKSPNFSDDKNIAKLDEEQTFVEENTFKATKKVFATASVDNNRLVSETLKQDLYEVQKGDGTQQTVNSVALGSTYGKIMQIVLHRPCVFSGTGEIYTPNGVDQFYTNEGDVVTIIDISGGPVQGKKWLIASTQSLKKDSNGNYLFDNNIFMDYGKYVQTDNMRLGGTSLTNQDKNGNFQSDAYIIFRNDREDKFVGLGMNVSPAGGNVMMRLENTSGGSSIKTGINIWLGSEQPWFGHHTALATDAGVSCQYLLTNGRYDFAANIQENSSVDVNVDEYDYLEFYPQGNGGKVNLKNLNKVARGKKLIIINRNIYDLRFPSIGYKEGPDNNPTAEDIVVPRYSVSEFVMTATGLFVKCYSNQWRS